MGTNNYNVLTRAKKLWAVVAIVLLSLLSFQATAQICEPVTDLTVNGLTETSATLSWTSPVEGTTWYDVRVSTVEIRSSERNSATADQAGMVAYENEWASEGTTYTLSNLEANTHYYVYFRHNCTQDYITTPAAWQSLEFSTPCYPTTEVPQMASFDDAQSLPSCWNFSAAEGGLKVVSSTHYGESGNAVQLVSDAGSKAAYLYSPVFAPTATAHYLSMKVYAASNSVIHVTVAPAVALATQLYHERVEVKGGQWNNFDFIMPENLRSVSFNYVWMIYAGAGDNATLFVDDIVIDNIPTCVAPNNLHVAAIDGNSLTLAWNERGNATAWAVEYKVAGAEESTVVTATANPFTLNGLTELTSYEFRVKSVCSATDESYWTDWKSATTPCATVGLPFVEDFNSLTSGIPACWDNSIYTCSPSYTWNYYNDYGTSVLRFNAYNATSGTTGTLLTPQVANGAVTNLMLTFDMKNGGNATLDVAVSTDGGANFPIVLATAEKGSAAWRTFTYTFTAPANSHIVVSFLATSDYGSYRMDIDNVEIDAVPTCAKPTNLRLGGFTAETATIAWNAGANNETNWILTYALNGGDVQTVTVSGTPAYEITGLEPQTTYTLSNLSVQAVCGADDNSRVVTAANITFSTACAAQPLPYTEGFEGTTFVPECWHTAHLQGTAGGWSRTTSTGDVHSGSGAAKLADAQVGNRNILTTPMFHSEAANTVRFTFWMKRVSGSKLEEGVRVWVNTTPNDTLGGTALLHVTRAYEMGGDGIKVPAEAAAGWYKYGAEIPIAGDFYLIFEGISEYGNYSLIDDITIEYVPTCDNQIYNLNVAKTAHEATIYWANKMHNNQWELTYQLGNNPVETVIVNDTAYTIEGLEANTAYGLTNLAIRVICAEGDTSVWNPIDNINFQTPCEPISLPLVEDFDDILTDFPSCWDKSNNTLTTASYNWTIYAEGKTGQCVRFNSYNASSGQYSVLLTPQFQVTTPRPVEVAFSYKNPTGGDFSVFVSRDGGLTYDELLAKGLTNQTEWKDVSYIFDAMPTDLLCIAFKATSNCGYGDAYIYLDDVSIKAPLCPRPYNASTNTVASDAATVSWRGTAANYQVLLFDTYYTPAKADSAIVNEVVSAKLINFTGLEANHLYYMYVKGNCEEEDSEWSELFTFRTECAAYALPYNEGFEVEGSELCWQIIGGGEGKDVSVVTRTDAFEGTHVLKVTAGTDNMYLVSPRMANALDEYKLWFSTYANQNDTVTISVMEEAGYYGEVAEVAITGGRWNEYESPFLTAPDYEGSHYFVFNVRKGKTIYLDAFQVAEPANCPKPTGLDYTVDGQNVVFNWLSDGAAWNVEILDAEGQVVSTTLVTERPFVPTGLEANTDYSAHVQSVCGEETSAWSTTMPFHTPCVVEVLPYTENFDGLTGVPNAVYSKTAEAEVVFPDCWSVAYSGTNLISVANTAATTYISARSGNNAIVFSGSAEAYIFLPSFEGDISLSFAYVMESTSSSGTFEVGYVTAAGDVSTFVTIERLEKKTSYTTATVTLVGAQSMYPVIKFIPGSSSVYYAAIDDISIVAGPTCSAPSGLEVSNPTSSSVDVTFVDGEESHTAWEVVAVVKNMDPATGTPVLVEAKQATVALTLVSGVTYDFYVRAVCGEEEVSDWSAPQSLKFVEGVNEALVTSGTDTNDYVPVEGYYGDAWSHSQFIIPADSLTAVPAGSEIMGLTFYVNNYDFVYTGTYTVSMKEVPASTFASAAFETVSGVLYSGNLAIVNNLMTIELDDNYTYEGGNLLIDINETAIGNYSPQYAVKFFGTNSNGSSISSRGSSGTPAMRNFLPKTTILYAMPDPNACAKPRITVDNVTSTSAVLHVENATNWEYVLNDVTATPIAATGDSVVINTLEPSTSYTVFVRNVCGADHKSAWTSTGFTTGCAAVTSVHEDFEVCMESLELPACWGFARNSAMSFTRGTGANAFDNYSLGFNSTDVGAIGLLMSPEIAGNLSDYRIRFNMKGTGWVTIYLMETDDIEVYDGATGIFVELEVGSAFEEYIIPFTTYTGNGHYVWIESYTPSTTGVSYIDNIIIEPIPNCDMPAQVSVVAVDGNSATLAVVDTENNTWQYVLNDETAEPTTITIDTIVLNDLEPQTTYTVYVRRVCGEGEVSEWRSVSFKTPCATYSLPYAENFDDYTGVPSDYYSVSTIVLPDCWEFINNHAGEGSDYTYPQAFMTSASAYAVTGNALFMKSKANESMYMLLPAVEGENGAKVSFYYRNEGTSDSNGILSFGYYNIATGTFEALATCERITSMTAVKAMAPYRAGTRLAFCYTGGGSDNYYCSIDNVVITEMAACEAPDAVKVANITETSVDIVITDALESHTAWEAVIVDHDADVTTGTPVALDAKVATLNSTFVSMEEHDLYVRVICNEAEQSAWVGPITFKYVDMSNFATCPLMGEGDYPWTISATGDRLESTNKAVANSVSDLVATVVVEAGHRANVSFDYWVESQSSTTDYLCMYVDVEEPTTSNNHSGFGKKGGTTSTIGTYTFTLDEGIHTIRWRYRKDGTTDSGADKAQVWNITIEDVSFYAPTITAVTGITATEALVKWTSSIDAVSHQLRLRTTTAGVDTIYDALVGDSLALSDLSAQTEYAVTVRSINANNDTTAWSAVYRFTTSCDAVAVPYLEDFNSYTNVATSTSKNINPVLPDCWTILNNNVATDTYPQAFITSATAYVVDGNALFFKSKANEAIYALLPVMETENAVKMSFAYRNEGVSESNGTLSVGYYVDGEFEPLTTLAQVTSMTSVTVKNIHLTEGTRLAFCYMGGAYNNYYCSIDNIVVEEQGSCESPDDVIVIGTTATSIDVEIADSDPAHTAWEIAVVARDAAVTTGTPIVTDSKLVTLTGDFISQNYYDFYVRTICGEGDTSAWTQPIHFKYVYVDYSEAPVEGLTLRGDGDYPWAIITDNGVQKLQSTNYHVANSISDMVTTVVVPEGKVGILSFDYYVQSEASWDYLCLYVNVANPSTDNMLTDFGKKGTASGVGGSYELVLPEAGTYTVRWRYRKDGSTDTGADAAQVWNMAFTIGAALPPAGLRLVEATADEATLTWDTVARADKYQVLFLNEVIESLTDTITLTGLEASTAYTAAVRAILGEDTTAWSAPITFRTGCAATMDIPFTTGFEVADGGLDCWTIHQTVAGTGASGSDYGDAGWQITTRSTDTGESTSSIHSGLAAAQLRDQKAGTHVILASPEFNAVEGAVQISFWMYRTTGTTHPDEGIKVWVGNDPTTTEGATPLVHVPRYGGIPATDLKVAPVTEAGWYQYTVVTTVTDNFYVLFEGICEYGLSTYMDDVRIARIATKEPFEDVICKSNNNEGYEGYGFNIPASDIQAGLNTFTRIRPAENELESDTVYVLNLYVGMPTQSIIRDTACVGAAYDRYGFNIANLTANRNVYERSIEGGNVAGCDSIIRLELYFPETEFAVQATICEGETYEFAGENLANAGTYHHRFDGQYCDSVVTLTLTVIETTSERTESICEGEEYIFHGDTLTTAGDYTYTYTNASNCEATETLHLTVIAKEHKDIAATITEGEKYIFNGVALTEAGTYADTLTSAAGCDSIVTLVLTVEPVIIEGLASNFLETIEIVPTLLDRGGYAEIRYDFSAAELAGMTVRVYDVVGQLVQEVAPTAERLYVGGFATSGLYIVKVQTTNDKQWIGQIVVK